MDRCEEYDCLKPIFLLGRRLPILVSTHHPTNRLGTVLVWLCQVLLNFFKSFLKFFQKFFLAPTNQPTRNGVGVALPGLAPGFGRAGVASGGATREVPGYQATRVGLRGAMARPHGEYG